MQELAASIKAQGVMQPIVLRSVGENRYEIIAGERRWRATQLAGLHKIPAVIKEVNDEAAVAMSLIENIQREDLNPMEEALALQRLIEEFDLTHQQVADAVGKSRTAVTNFLRLTNLSPEVAQMLAHGDIEMGHARALLGLENSKQMETLRKEILKQDLTVRQTEARVNKIKVGSVSKPGPSVAKKDIFIKDLEKELARRLGTKVDISPKKNGGKLVVTYYSDDDLDRIQGLMGSKRK